MGDRIVIRLGTEADVPAVLELLDDAAAWLVARGRVGQWGTEPQSTNPRRVNAVTRWARDGGLYLASPERDARVAGVLAIGPAPEHIPPVDEAEVYVCLLVTARSGAGRGLGRRLLDHARQIARAAGVGLLRLDCYAGDDRALVGYYERQGLAATEPFTVDLPAGPWPGQVMAQRLT